MVTIGIDARKFFDFGIGTYIQSLLGSLTSCAGDFSFHLYLAEADRQRVRTFPRTTSTVVPFGKYSLGELARFSPVIRNSAVGLFHEPHYTLPYAIDVPSVVTIHDLIHVRLDRHFGAVQRFYARKVIGHAVRASSAIITATAFSRDEILDCFPGAEGKLHVIPLAAGEGISMVADRSALDGFRDRHGLEKPFLFYTGSVKPHKNLDVLLRAWARARHRVSADLVLAGEDPMRSAKLRTIIESERLSGNVRYLGSLDRSELRLAFNAAEAFVFPSEYEGFGLPVLEAMTAGTPVIISDAGALVEVAAGAAAVFPRGDADALAQEIDRVLGDAELRGSLRRLGVVRAGQFSWRTTAEATAALYRSLL